MVKMTESQILFRVDKGLLQKLDQYIKNRGFKTRNEWFRQEIIRLVETEDEFLKRMRKIARDKGITNDKIIQACREVGPEVYREVYGDD